MGQKKLTTGRSLTKSRDRGRLPKGREQLFIAALISTLTLHHSKGAVFSAHNAAVAAGYKPGNNASCMATAMMRRPTVKQALARKVEQMCAQYEQSGDRTLATIAKIAHSNIRDYLVPQKDGTVVLNFNEVTRDQFEAVGSVETEEYVDGFNAGTGAPVVVRRTKFKLHDKLRALEVQAKIQKLINEGTQSYIQNNTIIQSAVYKEMQAMEEDELREFQEFKKTRGKTLQAAPPRDKE
jgi:phage terminase small subunit